MHTGTLRKLALALTFWLALHLAPLRAQLIGPYGTSPTTFEVDAYGLLSATGTVGTGSLSLSGAGTRMFWYPGKAAFRAGSVSGYYSLNWNDPNIGQYSVAFGLNTLASGYASIATGSGTASGSFSVSMGCGTLASGYSATALGYYSSATGYWSTAMGLESTASGPLSTAMGDSSASGSYATAMGGSSASGNYATAMGAASASGAYATAMGGRSSASGYFSTAFGSYTTASAYAELATGSWNLGRNETGSTVNASSFTASNPLFEIGNGSYEGRSDAFVVYGDGNVTAQGVITCAPGGDIPMYTGH